MGDDPGLPDERWPAGERGSYDPGYRPPRTDGTAVAALVLAILAFVVCPVVFAVVALFLAASARRRIAASGGTLEGESLCTAATVLSWVNIGLALAGILAVGIFGLFATRATIVG